MKKSTLQLIKDAKACTICKDLPHGRNPIFSIHERAKIVIIGQAPGRKVHESNIPWDDASGDRLREWLEIDRKKFYDNNLFSILPMGFCFPGTGKTGDLPPRKECAPKWHKVMLETFNTDPLILIIGLYAQKYYLGKTLKTNLTETVRSFDEYPENLFPLPHPSPRNNIWLKRNDWFEKKVLPELRIRIKLKLR